MQDPRVYLNPYIVLKHCGALNDNSPHGFLYLNTQFPVGSAVWRGPITFRSTVQLKEACHWGQVLRVDSPMLSVCSLCFRSGVEDVIFQLPAPVASSPPPTPLQIFLSGILRENELFSQSLLVMICCHSNKEGTNR